MSAEDFWETLKKSRQPFVEKSGETSVIPKEAVQPPKEPIEISSPPSPPVEPKPVEKTVEEVSSLLKPPVDVPTPSPPVPEPKTLSSQAVIDFFAVGTGATSTPSQPSIVAPSPPTPDKIAEALAEIYDGKSTLLPPQIPEEFDLSPAHGEKGFNKMIYGPKGGGKTVLAFSDEGTIACLSFDQQSQIIWEEFYKKDKRITVFDAVRYFSEIDPQMKLDSSERTFRYVNALLDGPIAEMKPDIIVIDGTEILQQICEMTMRCRNNLGMSEGFKNLNLWKERNMYMNQVHRKATQIAKTGVTYTAYLTIKEVTTAGGEVRREEPKWAGDIEYKTQAVIKVEGETVKDGRVFYATVENSKLNKIPTSGRKIVGTVNGNGEVKLLGMKALER